GDDPPGWDNVFTLLRDQATDLGGQLHHRLALGDREGTAAHLAQLLPVTQAEEWLSLLDQTVATPDPRLRIASARPATAAGTANSVDRLVAQLHAISDPRLSDRVALRRGYLLIAHDYRQLADVPPDDSGTDLFIDRVQQYQRLAAALA